MEIQPGEMEDDRIAKALAVPLPARHPLDPLGPRVHRLRRVVRPVDHDRLEERGEPRAGHRLRGRSPRRACLTSGSSPRRGARRRTRPCRPRRGLSVCDGPHERLKNPDSNRGVATWRETIGGCPPARREGAWARGLTGRCLATGPDRTQCSGPRDLEAAPPTRGPRIQGGDRARLRRP